MALLDSLEKPSWRCCATQTRRKMLRIYYPTKASARQESEPTLLAAARTQLVHAVRTIDFWIDRSRQRRVLGEIAELDDHLLHDIGVQRNAARHEAAKPFW